VYAAGGLVAVGAGYYALSAGKKDPVAVAKELTEPLYENKPPQHGGPPDRVFIGGGQSCKNERDTNTHNANASQNKVSFR
jgi:hypothetical protein